ncbi:MAG: ABC transporter substrate-binding protein [Micromonosporaceae bacterium]
MSTGLSSRRRWLAACGAALLTTAGCGSALNDEELIKANAPSYAGRTGGGDIDTVPTPIGESQGAVGEGTSSAASPTPGSGAAPPATESSAARSSTAAGSSNQAASRPVLPGQTSTAARRAPSSSGAGPPAGGGGTTNSPSGAAPAPGAPVPPGAPVKLGQIATRTGPVGAALQSGIDATRAWVADVNARGGLAGHPVQLVATDDRGDPNQALALARQLVEKDGILAFYASLQVTTLQAILPYVEQKGIPIIGSCACSSVGDNSPMVFDVGATSGKGLVWEHLAAMALTDKKKVGVLYCREAASCAYMRDGVVSYQKQLGFQVVYEAQVSLAQPDFTAEVIQARQNGAEILVTNVDNASTTRIARAAHRQGYHPVIVTQHGYSEDKVIRDGGQDVEGAFAATGVAEWSTAPVMADYREAMKRFVPTGVRGGPGANVWVAGIMLERLAREWSPQPTTADVVTALYGLRNETLDGRIPPTAYRPGVGHGDTAVCAVPIAITGGQFTAPQGPETFVCAPGWQPVRP